MLVFNSKLLNKIIFEKEVSKAELARRLNVHAQSVVNWTKGHSAPSPFVLITALQRLGVTQTEIDSYRLVDFYGEPLDSSRQPNGGTAADGG